MKSLARQPLVHFLILGAAIFVLFEFLSNKTQAKPDQIVITQGKIENMVTSFSRTWHRPPSEKELRVLIQDYIREEVAYREAKSMGLDQDDTIIRRRMRQKLEFVSEDVARIVEPTELELEQFLKSHPETFRKEGTVSFVQIYLDPQRHGEKLKQDAAELLAQLKGAENIELTSVGDPFLLNHEFHNVPESEIRNLFGESFAKDVPALQTGRWQGPIASGYGMHLVFVQEHAAGQLPALQEIRDEVQKEWANAKRVESIEKLYQTLLARYTVNIESPKEKQIAELRP